MARTRPNPVLWLYWCSGSILLGVLVYLRFTLTLAADSADSRLTRYGYPAGYGTTVRRHAAKARETGR